MTRSEAAEIIQLIPHVIHVVKTHDPVLASMLQSVYFESTVIESVLCLREQSCKSGGK